MDGWLRGQDPTGRGFSSTFPRSLRQVLVEIAELTLGQPDGWPWPLLSRTAEMLGGLYADARAAVRLARLWSPRLARLLDAAPAERPTVAQLAAQAGPDAPAALVPVRQGGRGAAGTVDAQAAGERRPPPAESGTFGDTGGGTAWLCQPLSLSRVFKAVTGVAPSAVRAGGAGLHTHTKPLAEENEP